MRLGVASALFLVLGLAIVAGFLTFSLYATPVEAQAPSGQYKVNITVASTTYNRTNYIVDTGLNITNFNTFLAQAGGSGTVDENSIVVYQRGAWCDNNGVGPNCKAKLEDWQVDNFTKVRKFMIQTFETGGDDWWPFSGYPGAPVGAPFAPTQYEDPKIDCSVSSTGQVQMDNPDPFSTVPLFVQMNGGNCTEKFDFTLPPTSRWGSFAFAPGYTQGKIPTAKYNVNEFPALCMAYKAPSGNVNNMIIEIEGVGWRSVKISETWTSSPFPEVASWTKDYLGREVGVPQTNSWRWKCINLGAQLNVSLGPASVRNIRGIAFWEGDSLSQKLTGTFWIDNFIIAENNTWPGIAINSSTPVAYNANANFYIGPVRRLFGSSVTGSNAAGQGGTLVYNDFEQSVNRWTSRGNSGVPTRDTSTKSKGDASLKLTMGSTDGGINTAIWEDSIIDYFTNDYPWLTFDYKADSTFAGSLLVKFWDRPANRWVWGFVKLAAASTPPTNSCTTPTVYAGFDSNTPMVPLGSQLINADGNWRSISINLHQRISDCMTVAGAGANQGTWGVDTVLFGGINDGSGIINIDEFRITKKDPLTQWTYAFVDDIPAGSSKMYDIFFSPLGATPAAQQPANYVVEPTIIIEPGITATGAYNVSAQGSLFVGGSATSFSKNYPYSSIVFTTPYPNVDHEVCLKARESDANGAFAVMTPDGWTTETRYAARHSWKPIQNWDGDNRLGDSGNQYSDLCVYIPVEHVKSNVLNLTIVPRLLTPTETAGVDWNVIWGVRVTAGTQVVDREYAVHQMFECGRPDASNMGSTNYQPQPNTWCLTGSPVGNYIGAFSNAGGFPWIQWGVGAATTVGVTVPPNVYPYPTRMVHGRGAGYFGMVTLHTSHPGEPHIVAMADRDDGGYYVQFEVWKPMAGAANVVLTTTYTPNNQFAPSYHPGSWGYYYQRFGAGAFPINFNAIRHANPFSNMGPWEWKLIRSPDPATITTGQVVRTDAPPSITVSAPASAMTTDTVTFSATATDDGAVTQIKINLDGTDVRTCSVSPANPTPPACTYSTTLTGGTHNYFATATDNATQTSRDPAAGDKTITVTAPADSTPPTVITTPAPNSAFPNGTSVTFNANASDNVAVASVQLKVDGVLVSATCTSTPAQTVNCTYSQVFICPSGPSCSHTYEAIANDTSGNTNPPGSIGFSITNDITPPGMVSNLQVTFTNTTAITWTWSNPFDSDYKDAEILINGSLVGKVPGSPGQTSSYTAVNLFSDTAYVLTVNRTFDVYGNANTTAVSSIGRTASPDTTAPGSVTGLFNKSTGSNYITWEWTPPTDSDYARAQIKVIGSGLAPIDAFVERTQPQTFTATGLSPGTAYTISIWAIDNAGNGCSGCTYTRPSVTHTATTQFVDTTPPAGVSNLTNESVGPTFITWRWVNPPDQDYDHVEIYINDQFVGNVSAPIQSYNSSGLQSATLYKIATRTVDFNGNINPNFVNATAFTSEPEVIFVSNFVATPSRPLVNQTVTVSASWSSTVGLKNYTMSWNATGAFSEIKSAPLAENFATTNDTTPSIPASAENKPITIRFVLYDVSGKSGTKQISVFVPVSESKTLSGILANQNATVAIDKVDTLNVKSVTIAVNQTATNIGLTLTELSKDDVVAIAPVFPTDTKALKYLDITKQNLPDSSTREVRIKFRVEQSWITSNNIDRRNIALQRFNVVTRTWEKLPTFSLPEEETLTYASFEAISPGLSLFSITGKVIDTTPPTVTIISPSANSTVTSTNVSLRFGVSETPSACSYTLDGAAEVPIANCLVNTTAYINITAGNHTIQVKANDSSGNVGNSSLIQFTVSPVAVAPTPTPQPKYIFLENKWEASVLRGASLNKKFVVRNVGNLTGTPKITPSGDFVGKMVYSLTPQNISAQEEATLDVTLNTSDVAAGLRTSRIEVDGAALDISIFVSRDIDVEANVLLGELTAGNYATRIASLQRAGVDVSSLVNLPQQITTDLNAAKAAFAAKDLATANSKFESAKAQLDTLKSSVLSLEALAKDTGINVKFIAIGGATAGAAAGLALFLRRRQAAPKAPGKPAAAKNCAICGKAIEPGKEYTCSECERIVGPECAAIAEGKTYCLEDAVKKGYAVA